MKRTYVDAGVLIAAARGNGKLGTVALSVIADESREFVCSDYVKLEVVPKPTYFGRTTEVRFYETFFGNASKWLSFDDADLERALEEACKSGLSGLDAVHVVVAAGSGCQELPTSERPGSAIHRTKLIPITSIDTD